ncbi:MAG: phenylalanine--tRNA ligase subunit beta, partial [Candidatus Aenigmarchaeota archaeon]|nr:phenylalanine--tRNA ligase subunit beta [Candidatus Aenigmarchaeota archaeon]
MPTIEVSKNDLERLVGKKLPDNALEELLILAKGELGGRKGDLLKIECKDTNRPDLWSAEGIARILRGHFELETGIPKYKAAKSKYVLCIDNSVSKIRPCMVACIVKNLKLNENTLAQMIQLQEKLAVTYGRKRREAAVGIFSFEKLKPPFVYKAVEDKAVSFVPLGFKKEMHPSQILKEHPKGKEYGHLLTKGKYPILMDSKGQVCSMPPIINSELTGKVTENTKSVLVEVSGYRIERISLALNVMAAALVARGGKIESVTSILPSGRKITSPSFEEMEFSISADNVRKFLGMPLSNEEIVHLLERQRYDARASGKRIIARYLSCRDDVMHERDLIEDIAIAFGYNEIEPEIPRIFTIGKADDREVFAEGLKEAMIGLGFQEIMAFILTNKDNQFRKMHMNGESAEISNPVSDNWNCLRSWLLPSALEFLSKNKHAEYPQKIFEIGDCVILDDRAETQTR